LKEKNCPPECLALQNTFFECKRSLVSLFSSIDNILIAGIGFITFILDKYCGVYIHFVWGDQKKNLNLDTYTLKE